MIESSGSRNLSGEGRQLAELAISFNRGRRPGPQTSDPLVLDICESELMSGSENPMNLMLKREA